MAELRKPLILTLEPVEAGAEARSSEDQAPSSLSMPDDETAEPPESPPPPAAALRRRIAATPADAVDASASSSASPAASDPEPRLPQSDDRPAGRARERKARKVRAETAQRTDAPEPRSTRGEAGAAAARFAYPAALAGAVLWAGALAAFTLGFEQRGGGFGYAPFRWAVTAGLALFPAGLLLIFAYLLRQSARLAEEARAARRLAEQLAMPAALAGAHAGGALGLVRAEIDRAQQAADEAARRLSTLGHALSEETRRVNDAAGQAERAAVRLGGRLQSERAELASLTGQIDAQLTAASDGAARQARLVAEASDLAQAHLQEAQAALTARTADMVRAASEALRASESAGGGLADSGDRLERLSLGLAQSGAQWTTRARALLAEQDEVAARLETGRTRYLDAAREAQAGAGALADAASRGADAVRAMSAEAMRGGQALSEVAREHAAETAGRLAAAQAALETEHAAALDRIAASAEAARLRAARSAGEVAAEAERAAEAARLRVEGLAEAAYAAGQRADQAFDARLAAARRAIDAQATLVEDAGLRSAARIEAGVAAVRTALGEADGLASEMERRFTRAAPGAADAMRLGSDMDRASLLPPSSTTYAAPLREAPPPGSAPMQAEAGVSAAAAVAEPATLRPRLRLAAVEEELFGDPAPPPTTATTAPAMPAPASASGEDAWSWKELLTAIEDPQPLDDDALAERLIGEIEAMGVDAGALLPRARIDEIAQAVDAGDPVRAREAVRRLAPAAVRRLSRRVLTDKVLRAQADLYRRRYGELVRAQAGERAGGGGVSALLGSDPGRAFLLLDAAVGDLH